MRNDLPFQGVLYKGGRDEGGNLKGPYHINTNFKNEISFLGTLNKVQKNRFLPLSPLNQLIFMIFSG